MVGLAMADDTPHIKFEANATLRKWPSLNNQRREDRLAYIVIDDTLDECVKAFMAKPASTRHLYEIHTAAQPPFVTSVLSPEHIAELARLRDFL